MVFLKWNVRALGKANLPLTAVIYSRKITNADNAFGANEVEQREQVFVHSTRGSNRNQLHCHFCFSHHSGQVDTNTVMTSTNSETLFQNIDAALVDFYVAFLLAIVFLSLVANITVLTALYTQNANLRNSMDIFIANMAVSDIVSSFSATFTLNNAKLQWTIGNGTCKMCYYLVFVSYAVTVLTLCLASLDRFYGICLPTKHRQVIFFKKQTISVCLTWILSCLLFAPYIYAYDVKEFKLSNGKTKQICTQTWNSDSEQTHYSLVVLLVLFLMPSALFVFVFVKVFNKLQEPRSTASGGNAILHKKRRQMTFMLLLMVALQYLCWSPAIIANTLHIFGQTSRGHFNIWLVFELLHFLRSLVYPLIYLAMYQNFRASLKALFSSCCSTASHANNTANSTGKDYSQPSSVPVSSAASDRSASYVPDDDLYTNM